MAKSLDVPVDDIADSRFGMHLQTADFLCGAWLASRESADEAPPFCANAAYLRLARS
jgi:hypothetical protein